MQKYWWYIKFGDLAIEHQTTKLKTVSIKVAQTSVMAIHVQMPNNEFANI